MTARPFELVMYALSGLGALPLALLETKTLAFFLMNTEIIQDRDAALEGFGGEHRDPLRLLSIGSGHPNSTYFAIAGPRPARINVALLLLPFGALSYISSTFCVQYT